jgi:hypothetical protein
MARRAGEWRTARLRTSRAWIKFVFAGEFGEVVCAFSKVVDEDVEDAYVGFDIIGATMRPRYAHFEDSKVAMALGGRPTVDSKDFSVGRHEEN